LDEIDYKMLEILRKNARTTNSDIAHQVKLTEGAVRNRIRGLIENGVIKRFTIDTEADQVEAIVLIKTETKASKVILKRIRKYTSRVFETAGEYDIATYLSAENVEKINATIDRLRSVNGVISTLTLLKIADDQSSES
jgi:Lrp/AsnC family transcriptional regulator of lysine biosynthesis